MRVPESKNVLDNTGVHPESYDAAKKLLVDISKEIKKVRLKMMLGLGIIVVLMLAVLILVPLVV